MKKISLFLALCLAASMLFSCTSVADGEKGTESSESGDGTAASTVTTINEEEMFSKKDLSLEYDERECIRIDLMGDSAVCESDSVVINESTVILRGDADYILSGTLRGTVVVDAEESAKPRLVLNGAAVESESSAGLYVKEADKVFLILAEGSENKISNLGEFEALDDSNIDGAIFSKQDLTVGGNGSLEISSPAGHGLVAKDDLVISGGSISVSCEGHGIQANDSIRIADGSLSVVSAKDGLHCENSEDASLGFVYIKGGHFDITCDGDGISASSVMQIKDGDFSILSGEGHENAEKKASEGYGGMGGGGMGGPGGHRRGGDSLVADVDESDTVSRKGIKASSGLSVSGGVFNIDSADDSVHSNADCDIFGASFTVASGDDGFHADGTLTVADGNIGISTSYEGLEGLHIKISGGDITLVSDDDGLNAAGGNDESGYGGFFGGDGFGGRGPGGHGGTSAGEGSILISGGRLYVNASGDGIDANGTREIRGGHTTVCGPTVGDTATLDYDLSATISGGTFIGTGGAGMAQTFSESSQGVIALSVGERAAKTRVQILTKDGKELISVSPELSFAVVILSCPEREKGESYTVRVGDNEDSFEAH